LAIILKLFFIMGLNWVTDLLAFVLVKAPRLSQHCQNHYKKTTTLRVTRLGEFSHNGDCKLWAFFGYLQ
jgi:hypothetical protein